MKARPLLIFMLMLGKVGAQGDPIQVSPLNPHYYSYQGKPILLITSA